MNYHGRRMKILCTLVLLLAGLVVTDDGSEVVADFRRFYAKAKTPKERFEAIQVLKSIDTLESAQALLAAFEDQDFSVRRAAIDVVSGFKREDTAHWLVDEVVSGKKMSKKPRSRAGAAEALGGMGFPFAYIALSALLEEKDPELRLSAITALGRLKDPRACTDLSNVVVTGDDPSLALAALDALALIGSSTGAEQAVLAGIRSPDWKVRARAIKAVGELHLKSGIRPLIERLGAEEGRLAGDAYLTLKAITMKDFGDTSEFWLKWWDVIEPTWTIPDYAKIIADRAKEEAKNRTSFVAPSKKEKTFLGVATRSESVLFVIDVSGSMEVPFADPDRFKSSGRTYSSYQRLEIVKEELIHTIEELPKTTGFNIIAFATDVRVWKKDSVKANVLNRSTACDWVSKLKPLGGQSAGFKAQAGLSTEDASAGATNTYLALMTALGEPVDSKNSTGFVLRPPKDPLDTIFFLTDGEPTVGKTVDMREIREEVKRVNAYRGIQIHVIYVGEFGGEEMQKLAHENGGVFVNVGG